jgi:8-amino-7-oxononanoate synthase
MRMADSLAWIDAEADRLAGMGLARTLVESGSARPGRIERDGRTFLNFSANDYLGLASDPRVVRAGCLAAERFGWGAGASPLITGWRTTHRELVEALADFEGTEAALVFPTGFAANAGAIAALVGSEDAVYLDRLDHACLVAGVRLSDAALRVYPHRDAGRLQGVLERERTRFRRVLIATDGVFGMDGDLAPLSELTDIAERFEAILLVDEAHGTGVFGPDGRGAASECQVADRIQVRTGTLSKALGSVGGFVAGSRRLIDRLISHAPTFLYSTALPPAAAAAAREALMIAQSEPWRRTRIRTFGARVSGALRSHGLPVGISTGPIVPIPLGDPRRAVGLAEHLREAGYLVPAIRPPTVPRGTSRLRVSLSAAHGDEDVDGLLQKLIEAYSRFA